MCRRAKNQYYIEKCEEKERLDLAHDPAMYKKVKELVANKKSSNSQNIADKAGQLLTEEEDIMCRWTEYVEECIMMNAKIWTR
jgi:hypothetical protein